MQMFQIAEILKVDKSTISREIRKRSKKTGVYDATRVQAKALAARSNSKYQGMKIEAHPQLKAHIIAELAKLRSPDEIAGRMKKEKRTVRVGTNAIDPLIKDSCDLVSPQSTERD